MNYEEFDYLYDEDGIYAKHRERSDTFYPSADSDDQAKGARFIPGEVTVARRNGKQIRFVQACAHPCCWYWEFPNGDRAYHFESYDHTLIAMANNFERNAEGNYPGDCGPCPSCGNVHVRGGYIR